MPAASRGRRRRSTSPSRPSRCSSSASRTQLGLELFDRSGRSLTLTAPGEQLLAYARRLLSLNDEAWGRMTGQAFEGELTLGVPQDIMYPQIPRVLRQFAREYPRVKVLLTSDLTVDLRHRFSRREIDVILTTEEDLGPGGETLRGPAPRLGRRRGRAGLARPAPPLRLHRAMRLPAHGARRAGARGAPLGARGRFGVLLGGRGQRRRRPRRLRPARRARSRPAAR